MRGNVFLSLFGEIVRIAKGSVFWMRMFTTVGLDTHTRLIGAGCWGGVLLESSTYLRSALNGARIGGRRVFRSPNTHDLPFAEPSLSEATQPMVAAGPICASSIKAPFPTIMAPEGKLQCVGDPADTLEVSGMGSKSGRRLQAHSGCMQAARAALDARVACIAASCSLTCGDGPLVTSYSPLWASISCSSTRPASALTAFG